MQKKELKTVKFISLWKKGRKIADQQIITVLKTGL
jgi:hypothetical protein